MLKYKGYTGHVEFDDEAGLFHGEVIDTRDVITFQGTTVEEIQVAFHNSVDDYTEFCLERGEKPDKPFSGKFVLRLPPPIHHQIYVKAIQSGKSLNKWVRETLEEAI